MMWCVIREMDVACGIKRVVVKEISLRLVIFYE